MDNTDKKPMRKNCIICNLEFLKSPKLSYAQFTKKLTCSSNCYIKSRSGVNNHFYNREPHNKGKTSWAKGLPKPEDVRRKISIANKGKKRGDLAKKNISIAKTGRRNLNNSGDKCHFWRGGITPLNVSIRMSIEYKNWRKSVFARDNYKCVWCGAGGKLNADHIKPFAYFPELRLKLENGRTLCVDCHKQTDTFGGRSIHYKNNLELTK